MVTYQETLGDSAPMLVAKLFGTTVSFSKYLFKSFFYTFLDTRIGKWNNTINCDDSNYC